MAHAYTPGLRITRQATIRRERRLPLRGEVLVREGDPVTHDQALARTELPGEVSTLNLVNRLGVAPAELGKFMLKQPGDTVAAGEPIAQTRPLIKWFRTTVKSPLAGTLESVSNVTGQVILRQPARPVEVLGYVDGTVVQTIPDEGAIVETRGAFIQGIFGVGGECWGELHMLTQAPDTCIAPDELDDSCSGKVLVAGALLTRALVERARDCGAAAVIGGGIRAHELNDLLGYDLGVAITGGENLGITVVVTEGFGQIAMAAKTFAILGQLHGRPASASGATQIRAGVQRPEIIVPDLEALEPPQPAVNVQEGLQLGDLLRVICVPHFGRSGRVCGLPPEPQRVDSEALVRVLQIEFDNGERATVPRANVELIEE